MTMAFIPGDIVQLKSGGQRMTVCGERDGRVVCDWHAANGDGWQAYYVAAQLVMIETTPILADNVQGLADLGVAEKSHAMAK